MCLAGSEFFFNWQSLIENQFKAQTPPAGPCTIYFLQVYGKEIDIQNTSQIVGSFCEYPNQPLHWRWKWNLRSSCGVGAALMRSLQAEGSVLQVSDRQQCTPEAVRWTSSIELNRFGPSGDEISSAYYGEILPSALICCCTIFFILMRSSPILVFFPLCSLVLSYPQIHQITLWINLAWNILKITHAASLNSGLKCTVFSPNSQIHNPALCIALYRK